MQAKVAFQLHRLNKKNDPLLDNTYLELPFAVFLTYCGAEHYIHLLERNASRFWHNVSRPHICPETGTRKDHKGRPVKKVGKYDGMSSK